LTRSSDRRGRVAEYASLFRPTSYPPHEREARLNGVPALGSGRIFPVSEESIAIDAVAIARHWPQIGGLDFGWDHPTAAAKLAWDRDSDVVYVTATYPYVGYPRRSGPQCCIAVISGFDPKRTKRRIKMYQSCVLSTGLIRFLQLLCDLARTGDEKLRQRAERAVSQCEDSDWIGTCR
jgi:hypothetical protein